MKEVFGKDANFVAIMDCSKSPREGYVEALEMIKDGYRMIGMITKEDSRRGTKIYVDFYYYYVFVPPDEIFDTMDKVDTYINSYSYSATSIFNYSKMRIWHNRFILKDFIEWDHSTLSCPPDLFLWLLIRNFIKSTLIWY